jgi:microcystin-dependent protein
MEGYIGEVRNFAGTFAPMGWSFCQGQQMSIANYQALYALIGTTYGGDGVTVFNLPDLRGRVAVGTGQGPGMSNVNLGTLAGVENAALTVNNLPAHNHVVGATNPTFATSVNSAEAILNAPAAGMSIASAGYIPPSGSFVQNLGFNNATPAVALNSGTVDTSSITANISAVGGSIPHNNMQPYLAVNFIICIEGIFPSRN